MSNPNPPETTVSQETRLIPLRLLRQDDANVRGNASDPAMTQADAELVASIKAHGLLENLVVTPRTKTLFGVAAGARRLRALQELVQLCGALLLQHAKPSKRLSRYVVYATQPVGRELILDTGDESRAQTEHQRLETECPGSDPCIFRRVYVQLDSTAIPTMSARPGDQARQDAEITTREQKEPA